MSFVGFPVYLLGLSTSQIIHSYSTASIIGAKGLLIWSFSAYLEDVAYTKWTSYECIVFRSGTSRLQEAARQTKYTGRQQISLAIELVDMS